MSRFMIPTNNMLLYVFEVKVDNYDEIYGLTENYIPEEIVEELNEAE